MSLCSLSSHTYTPASFKQETVKDSMVRLPNSQGHRSPITSLVERIYINVYMGIKFKVDTMYGFLDIKQILKC